MFINQSDFESIVWELKNEFQHEDAAWYRKAAQEVINEGNKNGGLVPNIINRLFR